VEGWIAKPIIEPVVMAILDLPWENGSDVFVCLLFVREPVGAIIVQESEKLLQFHQAMSLYLRLSPSLFPECAHRF
jgi:hypothetical protein